MANRQILKGQIIAEKVGQQEFQREVAVPLAAPINKALKENQQKIDEKQDELIEQLSQNQLAITNAISTRPSRRLQPAIKPPQRASSQPPIESRPYVDMDMDRGLDPDVITKFGFNMPSKMIDMSKEEITDYRAEVSRFNKTIGSQTKSGKITPEEANVMKLYNDTLKMMEGAYKKYKASGKGLSSFGTLQIDPDRLAELRLEAYKDGKKVLSRKVDYDCIDLLTKRFNKRKTYSKAALSAYARLSELSDIKSRSKKGGCMSCIKYYKNPQELVKRLHLLISSKEAGNTSLEMDNEIVGILNKLLTDGIITKEQFKSIHDQCV